MEDEELSAHRIIMTARSPVFHALLNSDMREGKEGVVVIQDVRAPVFRALLHFVYTDTLPEVMPKPRPRLFVGLLLLESMALTSLHVLARCSSIWKSIHACLLQSAVCHSLSCTSTHLSIYCQVIRRNGTLRFHTSDASSLWAAQLGLLAFATRLRGPHGCGGCSLQAKRLALELLLRILISPPC